MSRRIILTTLFCILILVIAYILLNSKENLGPQKRALPAEPTIKILPIQKIEFPSNSGGICTCPYGEGEQVCGSDYLTYSSACEASCYGINTAYSGSCQVYDSSKDLPAACTSCSLVCQQDEIIYLDNQGCPVCECKPAPFEVEVEGEGE